MFRVILIPILFISFTFNSHAIDYPETKKVKVVDEYHGIKVIDEYQWLEDWDEISVKTWNKQQNNVARNYLDSPVYRDALKSQIKSLLSDKTAGYYSMQHVKEKLFLIKNQPPKQQDFLVSRNINLNLEAEETVFDPDEFDRTGTTTIEWYKVSPKGEYLAIALSQDGSEIADLYLINLETGKPFDVVIPRVSAPTAGGSIAWVTDSRGFYYTRYPQLGDRPEEDLLFYQTIWFHKLGTKNEDDIYQIGKAFPKINEMKLKLEPNSDNLLLTMQDGDSGRFQLHIKNEGKWQQLTDYDSEIVQGEFIDHKQLLLLSRKNASKGKFVVLNLEQPAGARMHDLIPESDTTLASNFYGDPTYIVTDKHIIAKHIDGGPSFIRVYAIDGQVLSDPKLPSVSGVGQILSVNNDNLMLRQSSYVAHNKWLQMSLSDFSISDTKLSTTSNMTNNQVDVTREYARSKDGTAIPFTVFAPKNIELNGNNPLLASGYGGYGLSLRPYFSPLRKIWLDHGGIVVIANLRGGGEYGEQWHKQGMLTNKQNVFDDFYAVMSQVVARGYTKPSKLAIEGGSNGGLLMGAMVTQHPDKFASTISHVGIYDSLRSELEPNGVFNIPEFGTVKDKAQFDALYDYSPFHNVKPKTDYPNVLLMTGENDGRVNSYHSRKMTAVLQSASTANSVMLLRTSSNSGHGAGTPFDEQLEQQVDRFIFLFKTLGINFKN